MIHLEKDNLSHHLPKYNIPLAAKTKCQTLHRNHRLNGYCNKIKFILFIIFDGKPGKSQ